MKNWTEETLFWILVPPLDVLFNLGWQLIAINGTFTEHSEHVASFLVYDNIKTILKGNQ